MRLGFEAGKNVQSLQIGSDGAVTGLGIRSP